VSAAERPFVIVDSSEPIAVPVDAGKRLDT